MGIDTRVFIKKSDLKKLMWWELLEMYNNLSFGRWYNFTNTYELPNNVNKISLKEMVEVLAKNSKIKAKDRERIMSNYDVNIILQADVVDNPNDEYEDLRNFVSSALTTAIEGLK